MWKNKISIILTIILSLITPVFIKADVNQGINLSPISADIKLKTEQQYSGSFTLTNNEISDLNIQFQESEVENDQISTPHSLDWFTITNQETVFKSNSQIKVEYTVTIPVNARTGLNTKVLIANLFSTQENGAKVNLSIPFRLNIVVDSLFASETGTVIRFFDVPSKIIIEDSINLKLTIDNASTDNISKPIANINIINPTGKIIYTTVVNESLASIKGEETYNLNAELPKLGFTDIGQYTAQVIVTDSLTNKSIVKKVTFYAINKLYLVIIIASLIGMLLLVKFGKGLLLIIKSNSEVLDHENGIGIKRSNKKKTSK